MAKLIFRTKPPKKGYVHHESFMTHESKGLFDKLPATEIQKQAHGLVSDALRKLIIELDKLGYDQTKVGFYIHFKD
ncbi:hypothetical protein D3C85_113120 [compost metagenome]